MLTTKERRAVREAYAKAQNGLCSHCKNPLNGPPSSLILSAPLTKELFPENFFDYPVHLHHDHNTGLTVGAVHNRCNAFLWEHLGE